MTGSNLEISHRKISPSLFSGGEGDYAGALAGLPAGEEREEVGRRHRLADLIALGVLTAEIREPVEHLGRLHALGDHAQAELMRKLDRRTDNRLVLRLLHAHHERLVDLELVDREPLELRKGGLARTEVVDGDPEAQLVDARDHREGLMDVVHDRA